MPLSQIDTRTVSRLGAAWISEPFAEGATSRMTPLVHDGLMFLGAGPQLMALDARTGKKVWLTRMQGTRKKVTSSTGDAIADEQASGAPSTRAWGLGLGGGLVFVGLMNGHVVALREKTGEVVWDRLVSTAPLAIASGVICTPLYVDGVLYLSLGHETSQGQLLALDATTGDVIWRVTTIPEPGEPGGETWPQDNKSWPRGGAHAWASSAADPALGLVYFVTSNAGPPSGGRIRPGDNLFSVSLIAVEMKSGRFRWHRQLIHHDVWEADLSVPPVLLEVRSQGRTRSAVAAIRGDGYLFAFDRATGEPLVPIDERPVPQNPDLFTAPTQPFPRGADSILASCESWRDKVPAGFVLGCMFEPPATDVPNRLTQFASVRIAPMSVHRETGYVIAQGTNSLMWLGTADDPYVWTTNINGTRVPGFPRPTATVAAIDPRTSKVVWRKELPSYDDSGYRSNGGSLSTAGDLVFHQGGDGTLQAYDVRSGATLWRFQTDFALGDASPMSYAVEGRQYVAFIAGAKVWAFTLDGKLPQAPKFVPPKWEDVRGPIEDTNEIETLTLEPAFGHGRRYQLNEYAFSPYRARVSVGTTVKFINNGYKPRTIVARDGSWSTPLLAPTQVATIRFDRPGAFLYYAKEYPWSYGQIIVTPADGERGARTPLNPELAAQIERGSSAYATSCALCHGESLGGHDPAPALSGSGFGAKWSGRSALDLFDRMRTTMPPSGPGSLGEETYTSIVSYILHANDAALTRPLDPKTMQAQPITPR